MERQAGRQAENTTLCMCVSYNTDMTKNLVNLYFCFIQFSFTEQMKLYTSENVIRISVQSVMILLL